MQLIDKDALDEFIQGDEALLADLATMFTQYMPDMEARLRVAIADRDAHALHESAHQLKSRLGYFSARSLQGLATELESCGRDNNFHGAEPLFDRLLTGCLELLAELRTYTGLPLTVVDE